MIALHDGPKLHAITVAVLIQHHPLCKSTIQYSHAQSLQIRGAYLGLICQRVLRVNTQHQMVGSDCDRIPVGFDPPGIHQRNVDLSVLETLRNFFPSPLNGRKEYTWVNQMKSMEPIWQRTEPEHGRKADSHFATLQLAQISHFLLGDIDI